MQGKICGLIDGKPVVYTQLVMEAKKGDGWTKDLNNPEHCKVALDGKTITWNSFCGYHTLDVGSMTATYFDGVRTIDSKSNYILQV
jgi:hypothetical protein